MSWTQDYHVESAEHLLEGLTGKTSRQLLEEELARQSLKVVSIKKILLVDDYFSGDITGEVVALSDGRVFVPKLTEQYTSDGNYGRDSYHYVLESENPEVKHIDEESTLLDTLEVENNGC